MGFDNECILNIQSLPGEYFCPVCRTLIYPNEALQSQCTHLYCKPCLAYIVATTHACPYDGYLVTEADSKPLIESNAVLAETIGKVTVHCLYHRSGCQWQGTLSECITHCTSCTFGNSPVVCNRCGTQIIHRQVQEHTQICPGLQPQTQQVDSAQTQASTVLSQAASQDPVAASSAVPASAAAITTTTTANAATASSAVTPTVATIATSSAPGSMPALSTTTMPAAAAQPVVQATTPQQWYQQQQLQYQQYYQLYPGYDPYQQHYQQYAQYQQQAYTQYAQPQMQTQPAMQGHQQPSSYVQSQPQHQSQPHLQPQPQAQPQAQAQPLPQLQAQSVQMQQQQQPLVQTQPQPLPQPQPQSQPTAQPVQMQAQTTATGQQPFGQPHPQATQVPQAQIAGQQFGQPLQQFPQVPPQHQLQALPYQQTQQPQQLQSLPQQLQSLPQQLQHPHAQPQARPSALQQPPIQPQPHSQYPSAHPQSQGQPLVQPQHPAAHAVTGHQSYQPQILQQTQPGAPPQRPMVVHPQQQLVSQHPVQLPNQFIPQQPPRMPPPSGHMPTQVHQQPTQPPPQRPAASHPPQQSHIPAHQHGQQLHQYPGVHAQAPQPGISQQSHGHLHPGQQFPQGLVPSQQQMHPHGPNVHAVTQLPQQNVLHSQGLATHPPQAVAGRPMAGAIPPQPIQQFPGGPGKPIQPSLNQQSPNHLVRPGSNLPVMHELQKSHLPQSSGQGLSLPLSGGLHSGVVDKVGLASNGSEVAAKNADGSTYTEIYAMPDIKVRESQSEADPQKAGGDGKDSDMQPEVDSTLPSGRNLDCFADEQNIKATESKHAVKEELADLPEDGTERSHVQKDGFSGENQNVEIKPVEKSGSVAEVQSAGGNLTHPRESLGSREGQNAGEIPGKTQSQQLPVSNSDKSHLKQPTHQPAAPSYEGALFQPGYHDRNMSQVAWQGPPQVPSAGPLPGKEVCPPQHTPFGHPSSVPPASPRFPATDRILTPHAPIPGGIQDRRPQDGPPYQMQAPGQMRPLGQSFPDQIPRQGQPLMVQDLPRPPSGQPYGGSYPSDAVHGGLPGPGMPSSGRVPGHVGFPQQRFPEHNIAPQGHGQSQLTQSHAGGGTPHGEALPRPPQLVPHSGPFNAPNQMMQRGPPFHPEDRGGPSHLGFSNSLDPEMYDIRRPGFPDARKPDPLGQPNVIKANGIPGNVQGDGMHDPAFAHGAADERFKPLTDERFRRLPEDGISRPYPLDHNRHNVGHRDFEEDLKQFPRPAHLDSEGVRNFDNYNSRPLDRGPQPVGPDGYTRPFDRALPRPEGIPSAFPPNQAGTFPVNRPGTEHRMLDVETRRPPGLREEFGRPMDVPPFQSPIREFGGFPSTRFGSGGKPRLDEMDPRELHGFTERSKAFSLPSDLSAGSFHDSKISLPSMLGSGSLPGRALRGISDGPRGMRMTEHFESGEPISRDRIPTGEPGFGVSYGRDFPKEAGIFNMKRKPGTLGWCRICSVDCETVEGLDLHAQTRDHQKMAMEMVLAIKKECDKKQRISEGIVTHDDTNKSRKNFVKPLK